MRKLTPTQLRKDLYTLLDQVLESGEGIEVVRPGGSVLLVAQKGPGKLARLKKRDTICGNPDDLDTVGWADQWKPDFI